jgi:serine/threonine-protein kinase
MNVAAGSRLGRYDVISELGSGGMGRVFRASDTKLGRDVALKVIHSRFGGDADYAARFRREARILASLTHPNIAALYEYDEVGDVSFLVMELVPGETLAERLAAGSVPLVQALRIATQVAGALETAHGLGVIHRDLKPANIKIGPDGEAKVLDFGLAKALVSNAGDAASETVSGATHWGTVAGTPAYMSPEQARGAATDRRSDIWSFGCVLFELLTRSRPFGGDTSADAIASLLEREADWTRLPSTTPASIVRLLHRCLEKDPRRRLRDIGDARIEIEEALADRASDSGLAVRPVRRQLPRSLQSIGLVTIGLAVGASLAAVLLRPADRPRVSGHFVLPLERGEHLAGLDFPAIAIAADGSRIGYVASRGGRPQLFVRDLNSRESVAIPGSADAVSPFFSPDGTWIAFFAGGKLQKAPVAGGAPVSLCDAAIGFGGTWGPGNVIVFAPSSGSALVRVSAGGGAPTRMTRLDAAAGEFSHRWPELLPDGDTVLFTIGTLGSWDDAEIVAQSLKTGERHVLVRGGTNPHYWPPARLVYARGGAIMAVPFDAALAKVTGEPVRVLDTVLQSADGAAEIGVAQSDVIAYVPGQPDASSRRLVTIDRTGAAVPYAAPPRAYAYPRVSPDGRKLLVTIADASTSLWLFDVATSALSQLTFEGNVEAPVWRPDGHRATYSSSRAGVPNVFSLLVDGAGAEERLASSASVQIPGSWSPDGHVLAFVERHEKSGRDVMLWSPGTDRATTFAASVFEESSPRFAPDGRWIAYVSNETGQSEVYVGEVGGAHRKRQITSGGGAEPVWSPEGRTLYYRAGARIMAVTLTPDGTPARPRVAAEGDFEPGSIDAPGFDVTRDGQRFVIVAGAVGREQAPNDLHVLLGDPSRFLGRSR